MKPTPHTSADSSHYDKEAEYYDIFNEQNSKIINQSINSILKKYNAKTVLDLACGTGSQVFYLTENGYHVTGYDINPKMLSIAKEKAEKRNLAIPFLEGDMHTTVAGSFDAVITIFNAIGHLTKKDFEKTLDNIYQNLQENGIYIFDILNLDYLLKDDNITKLTIDWLKKIDNTITREIQYSTIDTNGILTSYDMYYEQKDSQDPNISYASQTLQIYSAAQLNELLEKHRFTILMQSNIDCSEFNKSKSERILTVARKKT